MPSATFMVTVHWTHISGKFSPREEIVTAILDTLNDLDSSIDLSGMGSDSATEYSVDGVDVEEQVAPVRPRKQRTNKQEPEYEGTEHALKQVVEVVFIDGAYRVTVCGALCKPTWQERGPAEAYRDMVVRGQRAPELVKGV